CNAYRLGSANPQNNGTWVPATRVELPAPVAPGGQVTLSFNVTAPSTPGTYNFQWQMVQECVTWFGDLTPNVVVTVQTAPAKDAQVLSQSVSANMVAGHTYPVSITLKNVGTQAWSPIGPQCNAYRLGSANPYNNGTWVPVTRVELPATVASGGQVTLSFNVTAPSTPGTYNFQWQMVQECVTWFGDFTPNVAVTVSP
ncbi:MAG: NBR1-Ig-like domain-containing protein, partial [Thermoanaerobaculia bacterium]